MIPCIDETISKWFEFRKAFERHLDLSTYDPKKPKKAFHTQCAFYYNLEMIRESLQNTMRNGRETVCIPYLYASKVIFLPGHDIKRLIESPTNIPEFKVPKKLCQSDNFATVDGRCSEVMMKRKLFREYFLFALRAMLRPYNISIEKKSALCRRAINFRFYDTKDPHDKHKLLLNPRCITEQETFQCKVYYLSVKWTVSSLGPQLADIPPHRIERMLYQAFKIQDLCDFEILCKDDEVVKAHKIMLWIGCPYFRGTINYKENSKNQLIRADTPASIVRQAITFIYDGKNPFADPDNSIDPVEMLKLSDEWLLRPLFEYSCQEIARRSKPDQGMDLILIGTTYNSPFLVEVGKFFLRKQPADKI